MMHVALLCLLLSQSGSTGDDAHPDPSAFAAEVRRVLPGGLEAQDEFAYVEHRRKVDISMFGRVTVGPLRTFEVAPGVDGEVHRRLVAVDGQPLDPAELARREAEYQRHLRRAAEQRRRESPSRRAARLRQAQEERREFEAMLDDAVAVFEPLFVGRDEVDGCPVRVVDLRPRESATVRTREGRWMRSFAGRIWVCQTDHQIVRLEMRAFRDVTVGWGVIGRIDKGSRVRYVRQRVDNVWLPVELTYEATGRTLLVRPFEVFATTTYSGYRRMEN